MKHMLIALAAGLLSTALFAQTTPAGALHVQRLEIIDSQGFEKPMLAATIMVPAGWAGKAQVAWNPEQRCGPSHQLLAQAQAPDGVGVIQLRPGEMWAATDMGGTAGDCPAGNFRDVKSYLMAWVQRNRPGARWLDFRPRPERSQPETQNNMPGFNTRRRVEGGQALIAYKVDGREMRETLGTAVTIVQSQMAGLQGGVVNSLHGQAHGVLAWRAPEGQLDFRQFDAVWASYRSDPAWKARIDRGYGQMAAENQATQVQIGQINAETSRQTLAEIARRGELATQSRAEIAAINNGTWQAGQASQDRRQTDAVRTIREVEAYRDPRGGNAVIELPGHYAHAWQLRDGSYLLTDNPQFNPARDAGQPGTALSRAAR
jgi:hypothetical protein